MTKPWELVEAEFVVQMCQRYRTLPEAGGLLDQPIWFLQAQFLVASESDSVAVDDPLANLMIEAF